MASGYWMVRFEVAGPSEWNADEAASIILARLSMYRSLEVDSSPTRLMVSLRGGPTQAPGDLAEYVRVRISQELEAGGLSGYTVTVLDIVDAAE